MNPVRQERMWGSVAGLVTGVLEERQGVYQACRSGTCSPEPWPDGEGSELLILIVAVVQAARRAEVMNQPS